MLAEFVNGFSSAARMMARPSPKISDVVAVFYL